MAKRYKGKRKSSKCPEPFNTLIDLAGGIAMNAIASNMEEKHHYRTIPPKRPSILSAYLAKLTRGISIDRWRRLNRQKRGGGQMPLALEELELCADSGDPERLLEQKELNRVLNQFVGSLPEIERNVFLCRYWYLDSIVEIAQTTGFSESKVASMLLRTRKRLKKHLKEAGF